VSALGGNLFSLICGEFARDHHLGRAGLLDLSLWNHTENMCKVTTVC